MRTTIAVTILITLTSSAALTQQNSFQDSLLEHAVGNWVLQGTIAGQQTTHDIDVAWVLAHQYLQIHEVSREKNADGSPAYEAIVYIGWDQSTRQYDCLWLDVTGGGGLTGQGIGHAKKDGDKIEFLFKGGDGSLFHTTFAYDQASDTWQWLMDGEENGKLQPFARVRLTRK